ncbi:hypothetical protein [Parasphingorhabdus sp.]|uniref:hypothetical protein n=1 Tax=Parasphingorhabdus sp. TaxID=2709688 RepID=UPI0030017C3A
MKFFSIILSAIIFCSSTNAWADDTSNPAKPFGVLQTLPNSYWYDSSGSIVRFFWSLEAEEISVEIISLIEGEEGQYSAKFRRSVDNSRVTADYKGPDDLFQSTVRYRVELPSPDRYELFSEDGQKLSTCRMSSNEKLLRCEETTATGEIKEFQNTRVTKQQYEALRTEALGKVQQIQIKRKAAAATRTMENNAREDTLRTAWGALINFIPLQNGVPVVVDRDFKAQWTWKNQVKPAAVRFSWRKNPEGIVGIFEEWSSPGSIEVGRFFWKPGPQPGQLTRKTYYSGKEAVFQIAPDGTLTGTGYGWVYGPSQQLVISDSSDGAKMAQYKASDTARSSPYATYTFVEQVGAFEQARADYQRSKVQAKQSGSGGIGGILMGAALGGALSGGSAEGIVAGARVLGTKDGAQQVYNEYESKREANEREAARSEAAFQASMRALQTSNAKPSNASPTTQPATSSVNPVSAQNSAVSGNAATQNTGSTSKGSGNAAKSFPNRPLQFILYVVPLLKDSDVSQPQCLSNVITVNGPPSWSSASRDGHEADLIIDRYKERFVQSCGRARGTGAASARTVSYINNYHEGVDVDEEYANRAAIRNTTLVDIQP